MIRYMCVVRNSHGQSSTACDLRVHTTTEPKVGRPVFSSTIHDSYDPSNNQLVIDCQLSGNLKSAPRITWKKDGIRLHLSSRFQQTLDTEGRCRLIIRSPGVGDSGQYTCVAHRIGSTSPDEISAFIVVPGPFKNRYLH
jgi:hypothetical protein